MPQYVYKCSVCENMHTHQGMGFNPLNTEETSCPKCGSVGTLKRVWQGIQVIYKTGGFTKFRTVEEKVATGKESNPDLDN